MFERLPSDAPDSQPAGPADVLSASGIGSWQDSLATALEDVSGLDDVGRVDVLRALEELVCTATAAQAAVAAELDASRRGAEAAAGVPAGRRGKGVASEVAFARRESPHRGQVHLGLATVVRVELPHTWTAWRAGRITEWAATVIVRETACLSLEHRLAVDETIAADGDRVEGMSLGELAGLLRAEAARLDPAAVVARRRKAEAERRVGLRPAPDTMTYLTALLPVKDGVAAHAALTRDAKAARAAGDERTMGQLMADALVAHVTGAGDQTSAEPATQSAQGVPTGPVELGLVMSDQALFAGADDTAHLAGYGPIPAELAREIVAGALASQERVGIRRLYTSPTTGELVAMESTARTFRGNLARFIRLRDQTCRTPWCDAPIRHLDHAERDHDGGQTTAVNGQGLCEACNYAKEATGWQARPGPGGTIDTTMPSGHRYRTRPPAIATITQTTLPPLRIDYILTG